MIKQIWSSIRRKNPENKKAFKSKIMLNNVYGKETVAEQTKRFHKVHYILKYKIVVPTLLILRRWIDKKLYKKPTGIHQEYIKMHESVFEEATVKWAMTYMESLAPEKLKNDKEYWTKRFREDKGGSFFMLNTIMRLGTVGFMNDDAYMEWLPFYAYEWYSQMGKHLENKSANKRAYHLLHTVPHKMDPLYELIYLRLKENRSFEVHEIGKQTTQRESTTM